MTSRSTKAIWIGSIVLLMVLFGASIPLLHRAGFYLGGFHLEKIDINETSISVGKTAASGILIPLKDDLIVADSTGVYEPKFPYLNFSHARDFAKEQSFQVVVKQKLPDGPCCAVLSNSRGKILLPLEKRAEALYVSSPFLTLNPRENRTYLYGYGIMWQEPGTEDSITIEVDKIIPNWK